MKTTHFLVTTGLVALVACALPFAKASADPTPSDGLGTWEGSGMSTDPHGAAAEAFTVTLVRKAAGAGVVRADGTIRLASGKEIPFWQEYNDRGAGAYTLASSSGSGGGRCFVNGMCQYYAERADGHAVATTVASDGAGKVRVLVTLLENGKATRFFAQTLVKK